MGRLPLLDMKMIAEALVLGECGISIGTNKKQMIKVESSKTLPYVWPSLYNRSNRHIGRKRRFFP
jgi:hypothetical protein